MGLRRLDGAPEAFAVGSAVSMLGDIGAAAAVLGAGEALAPVLARARAAGVGPLRAVRVDRLRPGLLPALTEALQGVETVWVLEAFPGVLGDEGWLTLLAHRATQGAARVVPVLRGDDEALLALDEPDARDLTLVPLPARRRFDLAGLKVSLAAWQSLELVVRAAFTRFPVDLPRDLDDFAAAVRAHCDAVGHPAAALAPAARPWDTPDALISLRDRASALRVTVDPVAWAALDEAARFALAHLASPRRELPRLHAALRATGLCPR
ncbi:MAG: nitrate reductase associated protein [Polyangiales bacterium]